MSVFRVDYLYAEDSAALRDEVRATHRAYLASIDGSEEFLGVRLIASGPVGAEEALLILQADRAEDVNTVLEKDPFAEAGAIGMVTVREWSPVIGELAHYA